MPDGYVYSMERLHERFPELEPHWRDHYAAMKARLSREGVEVSDYNPRLEQYFKFSQDGWLKTFTVRKDGTLVGYATIYVTTDMHNQDLIAEEDFIYVTPTHRNGIGRKLARYVLDELKKLGVLRVHVTALTDARVVDLWKRMGFKSVGEHMIYRLDGAHV